MFTREKWEKVEFSARDIKVNIVYIGEIPKIVDLVLVYDRQFT